MAAIVALVAGVAAAALAWCAWSLAEAARRDFLESYRVEGEVSWSDVFATLSVERLFQSRLLAGGVGFLLGFLAVNVISGALVAAVGFFLPRTLLGLGHDRRRALFHRQLLDALGLLSNSVRAGMTLPQAVELLVREMRPPIAQEFGRVLQEYRLGTDFDQALQALARRLESRDLDMLVNATAITRRSGGNVGEIFEKISAGIRERGRIEGKVAALAATGKMQAIVMAGMPLGIVAILYVMEPVHVEILFSTPLGLAAMAVVIALQVIAFLWIRRLTAIDV
jgi:tight adherence protein B